MGPSATIIPIEEFNETIGFITAFVQIALLCTWSRFELASYRCVKASFKWIDYPMEGQAFREDTYSDMQRYGQNELSEPNPEQETRLP